MRVIKIGGRAQSDPTLPAELARAWKNAEGKLCVVHGGGDEITALQVALGKTPEFVKGRRVTTPDDIQLLRMVLSGVINKRLVSSLATVGVRAVGISGEDGSLIRARRGARGTEHFALGAVGTPEQVNDALLRELLGAGYMAIVSPVATDAENEGCALNVNGDDAAAAIAAALGAEELLFIADVEGVLEDERAISNLALEDVGDLIARDVVRAGMTAKLDAAKTAISAGVTRVRIANIAGINDARRGTTVTKSRTEAK